MLKRCSLPSHLVGVCRPGIVTPWASINNTCLFASLLLTVRSLYLPFLASLLFFVVLFSSWNWGRSVRLFFSVFILGPDVCERLS